MKVPRIPRRRASGGSITPRPLQEGEVAAVLSPGGRLLCPRDGCMNDAGGLNGEGCNEHAGPWDDESDHRECRFSHSPEPCQGPLEWRREPYLWEVHDEEEFDWMCEHHWDARKDDV